MDITVKEGKIIKMESKRKIGNANLKKTVCICIGWIATVIQIIIYVWMVWLLKKNNMLPNKLLIIVAIVLAALIVLCRFLMKKEIRLVRFIIGVVIAALMCAALVYTGGKVGKLTDTLENITDAKEETTKVGVYVLADDQAQSIQDASAYRFGILSQINRDDTDNAVAQIEEELAENISIIEFDGTTELADSLTSGD